MSITDFNFDEVIDRRDVPALKTHRTVLGDDGMDLFPAGVADMDFRVATGILEAMQKRLRHGVFGYEAVPAVLLPALRNWFSERHGWQIDVDHVLRSPNVLNSLAMAVSLFTKKGDGVIVQPPVFFDFYDIIEENQRTIVSNPLVLTGGRYEMDFDQLEQAATNPRNRMLFLCNPHNPVGRVWTQPELERVAEICQRHGVLVVSDEIHADITFPGHPYTPFASVNENAARNSIICISPAKSFNIAACCSSFTIVADEEKRRMFQAENSRLTVNKNNAFASVAMEAAYCGGKDWLDAAITYIYGNFELIHRRLVGMPGVKLIDPEGTFLLWIDLRGLDMNPERLNDFLRRKAKWAVTRGGAFGEEGNGFVRVNIACPRSRISAALDQFEAALIG